MMKKLLITIATTALMALAFAVPAFAMADTEKAEYCEQILAAMEGADTDSVKMNLVVSDMDTAKEIMDYFWHCYYLGNRKVTAMYYHSGSGPVTIGVKSVTGTLGEAWEEHEEAGAALEAAAASLIGSTEEELLDQIYHYVMDHVEYDMDSNEALTGLTAADDAGSWDYVGLHATTYTAVMDGLSVCQGYAGMFASLCALKGIPCQIVSSGIHAYNFVTIGGADYVYDTTWDDVRGEYSISGKPYSEVYQIAAGIGYSSVYGISGTYQATAAAA